MHDEEGEYANGFVDRLQHHRNEVFGFVLFRVGGDRTLAEDVTQDCLIRVWETRHDNPPPQAALRAYVLKAARNLLRDRYRMHVPLTAPLPDLLPDRETPESAYLIRETVERLYAEIARMPLVLRETLLLRVEQELDYAQIAARLRCPVGTVRSRLSAARSRLRDAVGESGNEGETVAPRAISLRIREERTTTARIVTKERNQEAEMATNTELQAMRDELRAVQERLSALEGAMPRVSEQRVDDPGELFLKKLRNDLEAERKLRESSFGLGIVHVVQHIAETGKTGTTFGGYSITSAADLPSDQMLQARFDRMRLLTADPTLPKLFRHFFALRFAGKEMTASAEELGAAVGEPAERVETLLAPLVTGNILRRVQSGNTGMNYQWDGYDAALTLLLFTGP